MASSKDFRSLLFSLAHQLNQQEVDAMVWIQHLPNEYSGKSAVTVLQYMEQQGIFSLSKPEELIETLKCIKKNDLCKQVKEFLKAAKKSRKGSSTEAAKDQSVSLRFDSAEEGVLLVIESLDVLEESVKSCNVKRIEEVYCEAKQAADNLLMVLKRAKGLTRALLVSERNSSQQTRPRENSPASPGPLPIMLAAASAERAQRMPTPPQAKTSPQAGTPPKRDVHLSRSQSERCLRPALPQLPYQAVHTHNEEEEDEDEHDYDEPFVFRRQRGGRTLPRKTSDIEKMLQNSPPVREKFKYPGLVVKPPISSSSPSPNGSVPKHIGSSPNSSVLKPSTSPLSSHLASPVLKQSPSAGAYPFTNIQQIKESLRKTKEKYGAHAHPISVARAADTEVSDCADSSSTGDSGFEEFPACESAKIIQRPVPKPRKSHNTTNHRGPWQPEYSPEIEEEADTSGIAEAEYVNVSQLRHRHHF